ncbi:MAG: hypothetical protein GY928_01950 [Colwellia sp.]|nr:hypothetical protein [Colwellia sp.]
MNLYTRLRDISAVTFHEIKYTGNICLLDKDYDEEKKYNSVEIIEIDTTWLELYDEYYEKSDDIRLRRVLKNKKKNLKLLIDINMLRVILNTLELIKDNIEHVPEEAKLKTLSSLKNSLKRISGVIKFDTLTDIKTNIKNVKAYADGIKTRYELNFKDDMKVDETDILFFYEMKANIEDILKKDNIPEHINMLQWMAYEKQAKRKIKNGSKHNKGIGSRKATN